MRGSRVGRSHGRSRSVDRRKGRSGSKAGSWSHVRPQLRRSGRPPLGADVDGPAIRGAGRAPGRGNRTNDRGLKQSSAIRREHMPINPNASIEITAFAWVPEFAQGVVRDLRARWALEEAGLDYRVQLLGQTRPAEYLQEQPFDQVPVLRDGTLQIFESGAIVQYIGEKNKALLPRDPESKYRAIQWTYAALNSCEPAILNLLLIDIFFTGQEWAKLRRPGAEDFVKQKLKRLSDWLGEKQWLEGDRFTIGDLIMITTLRFLRHTDLVAGFPNVDAYVKRGEARPAFQQALSDQLAAFAANQPQLEPEGAAA